MPAVAGADSGGAVEQAVLLTLGGEAGELFCERVARGEECLLAVEDGGVGRTGIVVAVELAGAVRQLDAAQQGRVGVGVEVGRDEY